MRFFTRLIAPGILSDPIGTEATPRWMYLANRYTANRLANPNFRFQWPTVNGQTLNQHLLATLRAQTANHCSYCDGFPLGKGDESIDHFLPKMNPACYSFVCQWENLYLACSHCQKSKAEHIDPLVLRPDELEYAFERYFTYNYIDQKLETNPMSSPEDQQRSQTTNQFFDFNNTELITKRRHAFERYSRDPAPVLDDYNFRFIFDF
jgi:hypothetical protein